MRRRKDPRICSHRNSRNRRPIREAVESLESRTLLSVNVAINTAQQYQKIEGFGTSLATDPSLYESTAYQKMYYQDLGSSMLRVNLRLDALEGPDYTIASPVTLGPDLQADINLFNWQQPDVQADGQLAAAAKKYGLDSNQVFGVVMSPPHWMKGEEVNWYDGQPAINPDTGDPYYPIQVYTTDPTGIPVVNSSGGSIIDTPDNLHQFGLYLAAYIKGFQENFGVTMSAISLQNELAFHEVYNSCQYTPQLYVDTLKAVHQVFVQYGITTKIIGPDDVGVGFTNDPWILWRQMQYINAVRADSEAMAALSAYSIHGLAGPQDGVIGRSPEMWGQYVNGRSAADFPDGPWWTGIGSDGKESWETEGTVYDQNWNGAFTMAENIQDALVIGNVNTWMYWQTADGTPASPYNLTSGTDETTQKFAAARQFFRYIRPGSYRVAATPSDPNGVYVSAFVQGQEHTLTTVLINTGTTDQTVNLSVAGVNVSSFDVDRRTSATDTFADEGPVPVVNGVATITLPAGSIVTLQGATAVRTDNTTQGNWNGAYGSDGYVLFGGSSNLPAFAQVAASGESEWTWDATPTDPRAPQDPASPSGRIAACDYSGTSFTLDVNLTDGNAHQVALYMVDWDRRARSQNVQVTDETTGAVLDSANVANFANGQWLVFNLSGHVQITLTNAPGSLNAVASGLFFDPTVGPQATTASFVTNDAATGGHWTGVYGSDGYSIVSGATSLPAYARVTTVGASTYTEAYGSSNPAAPQSAPGSTTGVLATEYAAGSFSINVNMLDGKTHQLAAYLFDWSNQQRTETVQVTDSDTGALLDSQTVSGFHSGDWLVWNLSGRVTLTFICDAGPNALLSGLAFGPASTPVPASATFVAADSTTQGKWTGTYGADGYALLGASGSSLPAYARLSSDPNQLTWLWGYTNTDPRALQVSPGATTGVAACDVDPNRFTLDLNLADGQSHRVALYMMDFESRNRAQTVQITDANTGAVLDTESVTHFVNGRWLVWNLTGHVKITLINDAGSPNAVASGLFFG